MISSNSSDSRTYIMLLQRARTEYQFIPFQLPDSEAYENNAAIASNCFQQSYLSTIPIDQAGLLIAAIPIEQFLPELSQYLKPQLLIEDLTNLLSGLYTDAEMALSGDWERTDAGFEAQLDAIDRFVDKYQIPIVDTH